MITKDEIIRSILMRAVPMNKAEVAALSRQINKSLLNEEPEKKNATLQKLTAHDEEGVSAWH